LLPIATLLDKQGTRPPHSTTLPTLLNYTFTLIKQYTKPLKLYSVKDCYIIIYFALFDNT